jgi:hypothetical protein
LDTKILKVAIVTNATSRGFFPGEIITGLTSNSQYSAQVYNNSNPYDSYGENLQIEEEAISIIDFSEENPFGSY